MPRVRLASALLVPDPFAREIEGLRRALGDDIERVAPHLTLVPPVNVRVDEVPDVLAQLRAAGGALDPFAVTLGPPATFQPVNPVVYLEVGGDVEAVNEIRNRVFVGALVRKLTHKFVPHVTISENTAPDRIDAALIALADYGVEIRFESVHLLQEVGRRWTPIAEARFEEPLIVGRGGIETEITSSSVADPEVAAFVGDRHEDADQVIVGRRAGAVVAVAFATGGELTQLVGDRDLERQLLKLAVVG